MLYRPNASPRRSSRRLANVCSRQTTYILHDALTRPLLVDRTKRVKDARSEAQQEIADYRKQKEDEFKAYEKEVWSHSHSCTWKHLLTLVCNL